MTNIRSHRRRTAWSEGSSKETSEMIRQGAEQGAFTEVTILTATGGRLGSPDLAAFGPIQTCEVKQPRS